ncbi:MAG: flavodoxin, partial [Ruminococcaceae bacterium]|nr:flavodoxin [Oscillospiraceae bacterium]
MKTKMIALLLICSIAAVLTACGGSAQPTEAASPTPEQQTSAAPVVESEKQAAASAVSDDKILIVYFAMAENSDVDAVSSASVIMDGGEAKGMSKYIADIIVERTGGELFSIRTEEKFPGQYDPLANRAKEMQNDGELPPLTSHIENLDDYDVIFVGYPVWWYTLPQVMFSFFDEYDFTGKTIVPFVTHYGSRDGGTFRTI